MGSCLVGETVRQNKQCLLLEPKSLAILADELLTTKPLEEYVRKLQEEKQSDFHVHCALCGSCLLERDERSLSLS